LQIRSWKKIAARWNRDERAVRNWKERGAPIYQGDDDVYFTDEDELDAWLESRDAGKADSDNGDLTEQRIRKTRLEADALELKNKINAELYGSIQDFEQIHLKEIQRLELSDLPPADKEKLQARMVDQFNEIADSD